MTVATAAGVSLIVAAERLRVPSIALLLLGGVALGRYGLGVVDTAALGRGLELVISLAVGVILFEGGMTLDVSGYRRAPAVIRRLLSVGVLVTWLGVAALVYTLFGLTGPLSLLAGALVIVTGPTVISPLLRRMVIRERLHHVLYWEGVLIDAVGVFVAVLIFEYIHEPGVDVAVAGGRFLLRTLLGAGLGVVSGLIINSVLDQGWIPGHHTNIFVLSCGILCFGAANAMLHESGLLAVVVAGLVLAILRPAQLQTLRRFKLQLTELAIGLLFILLSAKLDLSGFVELGGTLVILLLVVLFVIRPLGIWLSTWGQGFSTAEKVFLSWLAPRGIVAASMASLFSLRLTEMGYEEARHLETFTYAIVGTTVIVQGFTAPWLARVLGVQRRHRDTWLLVGDQAVVGQLESAMGKAGVSAVSIDQDMNIHQTTSDEGAADFESALADLGLETPGLGDIDHVLCVWQDPARSLSTAREWAQNVQDQQLYVWTHRSGRMDADSTLGRLRIAEVWNDIESPARVAVGIENGVYAIDTVPIHADDQGRFGPNFQPLFWIEGDHARLVSSPGSVSTSQGEQAIVLRRRIPRLGRLIGGAVIIKGEQRDMTHVVEQLLGLAQAANPELPAAKLREDILGREAALPTYMGRGIAMPHTYSPLVDRSVCYVGIVPEGVPVETPDGEPVRFVALVLSPSQEPEAHLRALAALAELAADGPFIKLLTRQTATLRVLSLIAERS